MCCEGSKAGDGVSGEVAALGKVAGEGLADVRESTMQMFSGRALQMGESPMKRLWAGARTGC